MYKKSINHSYDGIHEVKPRVILSILAKNLHSWILFLLSKSQTFKTIALKSPLR